VLPPADGDERGRQRESDEQEHHDQKLGCRVRSQVDPQRGPVVGDPGRFQHDTA